VKDPPPSTLLAALTACSALTIPAPQVDVVQGLTVPVGKDLRYLQIVLDALSTQFRLDRKHQRRDAERALQLHSCPRPKTMDFSPLDLSYSCCR